MRVANTCAFYGDRIQASQELLSQCDVDFLTLDYLAELTMGILLHQKEKETHLGYAKDFLEVFDSLIPFWEQGKTFKVVTNAGGVNPHALVEKLRGRGLKIGLVENGVGYPYLGASPIKKALDLGAQVVITGRVSDPSLVVGCAMHTFGWKEGAWDQLAQGTVAGHLLECGTQVTGGLSPNWLDLSSIENIGYPIAEIEEDGTFVVTKPPNTSGMVTVDTVKEQLIYEVFDPQQVLGPDVTSNFLDIELNQVGKDRVEVRGAKGELPKKTLKLSQVRHMGWYAITFLGLPGPHIQEKGEKIQAFLERRVEGIKVYFTVHGEYLRLVGTSDKKEIVTLFTKEVAPLVTAGPAGVFGYATGRAKVLPMFQLEQKFIPKAQVAVKVEVV